MSQSSDNKFYCHKCGKEAMFMDKEKRWWCYMEWKKEPKHGICKKE